jgi:hypothetical protein
VEQVKPSVGRIVHYVSYGTPGGEFTSECRAAIVTAVDDYQEAKPGDENHIGAVDLCVLNPTGMFFNRGLLNDEEGKAGGTWHWPKRED